MSAAITRRVRRFIATAAMAAGAAANAQTQPPADELDLLAQENLVYSAARYAQTIAETPANVSIISRDDIRRYGYRSVADALKSLPGVYDAASQWPALGVSGVAVPGDFGSRILYLVNGMPVYEPTYGGFFLEYLDIESIRFGPSLKIEKHIDPATLGLIVPSMILQPLVENSIKHGLAQKLGEGRITIRSLREKDHAIIDVIDNGVGVRPEHADRIRDGGIGLRNVNERLRVIYGANYQLQLDSVPGEGTCARVVIPELVLPARITA